MSWRAQLLLVGVLAIFFAMALWTEAREGMPASALQEWLEASPAAMGALFVLRFGSAAAGLVLLGLGWRRWDQMRRGLRPRPAPIAPTTPFPVGTALLLILVAIIAAMFLGDLVARLRLEGVAKIAASMAVLQVTLVGAAVFVIVHRRRLLAAAPAPSAGFVLGRALAAFCIAAACVLPATVFTLFVLSGIGHEITLYGPVEEVVKGSGAATPWLIAFFSVALAPIGEETLFRGLLYPALRSRLQGRDRAVVAAIVSSLLFAIIHGHAPSFLPLFVLAMVLAWAFERTNSLLVVIVTHALWNAATLTPLLIRGMS